MINRGFILSDILIKNDYEFTIIIDKNNKMEFNIKSKNKSKSEDKNKKKLLKLTLLDASWVYINSKRDTFLFNRGNFKNALDELQ